MKLETIDPLAGTRTTTFLVAGHPRSGTSMMMGALAAGGLDPAHSPELDRRAANRNGYEQNPRGFYELSPEEQRHPWFPMRHWGRLIKVQHVQIGGLAPGRYLGVFMMRHPREIRMSYEALGGASARQDLGWDAEANYYPLMKRYLAAAAMRSDMQLLEVWFSDVIAEPVAAFERIRDFGFPIDASRSAGFVEPALYRHRVERADDGAG